ncbi:MAG: AAA family ATPase [Bacteroidales bacterium]|jgi:ATP-dependent exoDNAse (exonuclease V) alpha subunit|nr:AAA family ATPase [Bacteroidales bacterium]
MLSKKQFIEAFISHVPHTPTNGQNIAIQKITQFLYKINPGQLFILKGYAGTGKTTLISALVNTFAEFNKKTILLAPTGRAAKVFSVYSGKKAFTIHKFIYKIKNKNGIVEIVRKENKWNHTLFIVDEVSMISNLTHENELFGNNNLLDDLINFVFEGENNKLLFIGDDAQLPPVHSDESPAMNIDFLRHSFHLEIDDYQLTDVVRQTSESGILYNATLLRSKINHLDFSLPVFSNLLFEDFQRLSSQDLEEELNILYTSYDPEDIVIITRSNKRALIFNNEIRNRIFYRENQIATGDYIMSVKNNYHWIEEDSEVGFLANGDMMEIQNIIKTNSLYGFNFADVRVRLCDYPQFPDVELKVILNSLESPAASLSQTDLKTLYHEVSKDYEDIPNKRVRFLKIKNNPYLNAAQVKFSYALTCHKTQGGQWKIAFIDFNYIKGKEMDKESLRWLYTALTRTTEKVYLLNFPDDFFGSF